MQKLYNYLGPQNFQRLIEPCVTRVIQAIKYKPMVTLGQLDDFDQGQDQSDGYDQPDCYDPGHNFPDGYDPGHDQPDGYEPGHDHPA